MRHAHPLFFPQASFIPGWECAMHMGASSHALIECCGGAAGMLCECASRHPLPAATALYLCSLGSCERLVELHRILRNPKGCLEKRVPLAGGWGWYTVWNITNNGRFHAPKRLELIILNVPRNKWVYWASCWPAGTITNANVMSSPTCTNSKYVCPTPTHSKHTRS